MTEDEQLQVLSSRRRVLAKQTKTGGLWVG